MTEQQFRELDPRELDQYSKKKWAMIARRDYDFDNEDCYMVLTGEISTDEIMRKRG